MTAVDPFGFQPDVASCIPGLGGSTSPADPAQVFHTAYVDLPPGPQRALLRFTGLEAAGATLVLRANALGHQPGARAQTVATESVRLDRQPDSGIAFTFAADAEHRFALLGHIYSGAEVRATGLSIEIEPVAPLPSSATAVSPAAGQASIAPAPDADLLIAALPPSLRAPVSQHATFAQLAEAGYTGAVGPKAAAAWATAYRSRVIDLHGVDESTADLQTIALDAPRGALARCQSAIMSVRHGGLALVELPLAVPEQTRSLPVFDPMAVQRLAVELLSLGHEVTQLAFDWRDVVCADPDASVTPFVLLVRRGA